MREFKIAMFGSRYVGKTSLLTAMYQQLQYIRQRTDIELVPDPNTAQLLEKRLAELKSLSDDFNARAGVHNTEAAAGPDSLRSFLFDLGKKGTKPSVRLHFQDYPGGYIVSQDSDEQRFVRQLLAESVAVEIVIDAPALMEAKGQWHHYKNTPLEITAWFKNVYQDIQSPRLVILTPVKCESYIQNSKSATQLLQRVKAEYANLLGFFGSKDLQHKVAVVVAPVQTVGNVFFSRIQVINGNPQFLFTKRDYDAEYNPQDGDQPLKYILRFLLKLELQNKGGMFNSHDERLTRENLRAIPPFLRGARGDLPRAIPPFLRGARGDLPLKQVVGEFVKDCKTTRGFEVIQGKEWLNS